MQGSDFEVSKTEDLMLQLKKLCGIKMDRISIIGFLPHEETILEISGIFSFVINGVKKIDSIIEMKKLHATVKFS